MICDTNDWIDLIIIDLIIIDLIIIDCFYFFVKKTIKCCAPNVSYGYMNTNASDRTKAERQAQVKPILEKLTELKLHASKFAAVKALMLQIQDYIKNGEPQQINIVFPEFGRRIKGTLETNRHSESSVKLQGGDERPP